VYKLAKERGYKNILVLEDDFVFILKKKEVYENLRKLFDEKIQFDVCMLAYNNTQTALPTEYDFLLKTVEAQTASAYIVNERIYDRLIELFEWAAPILNDTNEHWIYANDQIWKKLQNDPEVRWYCFKERVGKQQDGYSDNSEQYVEVIEN
jgi:GR25 family glycosyltransferase involved in LPS biosynthesis